MPSPIPALLSAMCVFWWSAVPADSIITAPGHDRQAASDGAPAQRSGLEPLRVVIHTDLSMGLESYGYDCYGSGCATCFHPRDVDDGWAIPYLLTDPSVEVVAILVQFGNAFCYDACTETCDPTRPCEGIEEMVALAEQMVAWSGTNVPVFGGSRCQFDPQGATPAGTTEVLELLRAQGPALVMGIGNAADPAYMIRDLTATDELHLIDTLVLEMGQWGPWYDQPKFLLDGKAVGDANVLNDQGAISWLIEQPALPPVQFVPFNAVRMGLVTPALLDSMLDQQAPVSQLFSTRSQAWMNHWASIFNDASFHLWDVVTMLSLLEGSSFKEVPVSPSMKTFTDSNGRPYQTLQLENALTATGFTCKPLIEGFGPPLVSLFSKVGYSQSSQCNPVVQLALRGITRLDALADCPADLNGDRVVDASDLTELLARWGEPCVVGD